MLVVAIGGSPSAKSRSTALLNYATDWLTQYGVNSYTVTVKDFLAEDLLYANFDSPQIKELQQKLAQADGVILATPIYKAAYSGALKTILDLFPERALANKVVLPIATAGSSNHLLALDYALKPVIGALKAKEILQGVFANDQQITYPTEKTTLILAKDLELRLESALQQFYISLQQPKPHTQQLLSKKLAEAV
ncbi:NADPH-dependent FMN reductase [Entomomonas asaccharolytica]|uniref:NADPH-dependent FMN reductase n=1 Tax=Entomomonas asaccharolytica TaxID=2785331 RepID=A0A974RY85_9GAMM|nr:NADPH-dependent FMN reductase [Entomomonas asaccharolytica]QQP87033.1 NADPH-dependent FMN reductase [Entomomonas asaccharolytica]